MPKEKSKAEEWDAIEDALHGQAVTILGDGDPDAISATVVMVIEKNMTVHFTYVGCTCLGCLMNAIKAFSRGLPSPEAPPSSRPAVGLH